MTMIGALPLICGGVHYVEFKSVHKLSTNLSRLKLNECARTIPDEISAFFVASLVVA